MCYSLGFVLLRMTQAAHPEEIPVKSIQPHRNILFCGIALALLVPQVALAQVVPDPVAPAPAVLAQVLADAPVPGVALCRVVVRTAHTAIHRPVRQSRQVIQIRPQSRHRAIWITTKSQTVMTVHSAVAVNQLG